MTKDEFAQCLMDVATGITDLHMDVTMMMINGERTTLDEEISALERAVLFLRDEVLRDDASYWGNKDE
jgi:hypothetical protein